MDVKPELLTENPWFPAFMGSLVGLRAMPGTNFWERGFNLLGAFSIAIFIGPATVDWLSIVSQKIAAGVIFASGATGLVLFSAVLEGIKKTGFSEIIQSWLKRS